jgi:hypothetical protein
MDRHSINTSKIVTLRGPKYGNSTLITGILLGAVSTIKYHHY